MKRNNFEKIYEKNRTTLNEGSQSSNISSSNNNITQNVNNVKPTKIQGLGNYTTDEVKTIVKSDIEELLSYNDLTDVEIKGIELHGSKLRENANVDSNLDVVVEYDGNIREDDLFDKSGS